MALSKNHVRPSSLEQRLNQLKPEGVNLDAEPTGLQYQHYNVDLTCTEKQLDNIKSRLRMLRIKFDVREV